MIIERDDRIKQRELDLKVKESELRIQAEIDLKVKENELKDKEMEMKQELQ